MASAYDKATNKDVEKVCSVEMYPYLKVQQGPSYWETTLG